MKPPTDAMGWLRETAQLELFEEEAWLRDSRGWEGLRVQVQVQVQGLGEEAWLRDSGVLWGSCGFRLGQLPKEILEDIIAP